MDTGMIWITVLMLLMVAGGIVQFLANLRKKRAKQGS
jgi:hypothetical protein